MKKRFILIMLIDPVSTSEYIILKSLKYLQKSKCSFIFIGDVNNFNKIKEKINIYNKITNENLKKKIFFYNISSKNMSNFKYINKITNISLQLLDKKIAKIIINMPINKKKYLKKNFNGFTEFFANKLYSLNKENMLLFNNKFSVLPLTTHYKIKEVTKKITKKKIIIAIKNLNNFYKKIIKKKPKIKILGLNPHAGADFDNQIEDKKIILNTVKSLKNKNVTGPISADTAFINYKKLINTSFIGMYHDQVLPIFKTLFNHNGINITIGLKYLRLSPDHGTGIDLIKNRKINNISNKSFLYCIKFCEKFFQS